MPPTNANENKDGGQKDKQRLTRASSTQSSRNNSTTTPLQLTENDDDVWNCLTCKKTFCDTNDKLLECQRCRSHYCIKCLNKPVSEYEVLSRSDTMWFCVTCREIVEKNIITDLKIEERCKEIMASYDQRVTNLENEMEKKCDEEKVRDIIQGELESLKEDKSSVLYTDENTQPVEAAAAVSEVISELKERKAREKNIVIYDSEEIDSDNKMERENHDLETVTQVFQACKLDIANSDITKVNRIGKFDKEKKKRPILATLESLEKKGELFKNITKLQDCHDDKIRELKISNDLTKEERKNEQKLYTEAKRRSQGEDKFKVRGPPWARRIVKIN